MISNMTPNTKAILATVAAIFCFAMAMTFPAYFFVGLFLVFVGVVSYVIYRTFLNFFAKKVK